MLVGKFVPILNSLADVKLVLKSFSPKKVSLCERERERERFFKDGTFKLYEK